MDTATIKTIVIVSLIALPLIIFLIWKNQKDRKALNPDAGNAVEETMMDKERKTNRT